MTAVWWTLSLHLSRSSKHVPPHLRHSDRVSDRWPQRLINQRQHWPACAPSITADSDASMMASKRCLHSKYGRPEKVPGTHFMWMGTVRIMMINIANPHVRFYPGIRMAEMIHWSFPWGSGASVTNHWVYFGNRRGLCADVCCERYF